MTTEIVLRKKSNRWKRRVHRHQRGGYVGWRAYPIERYSRGREDDAGLCPS